MRPHHEIATAEALGLLALMAPILWRPFGEKIKRILKGQPKP